MDDFPYANATDIMPALEPVWTQEREGHKSSKPFPFILESKGVLNTLELIGDYLVDVPLRLPSMFVLKLHNATLQPATNFSRGTIANPGLLHIENKGFTAILGGVINAESSGVPAISVLNSHHIQVHFVRASALSGFNVIYMRGGENNEIANSRIGNDGFQGGSVSGIVIQDSKHALIHDNEVRYLPYVGILLKTGTAKAAVYSNNVHHVGFNGIEVKGLVENTYIHDNTCWSNKQDGIFAAPDSNGTPRILIITANVLVGNSRAGITTHATSINEGDRPENVMVADNIAYNNGEGAWNPWNLAEEGMHASILLMKIMFCVVRGKNIHVFINFQKNKNRWCFPAE